MEYCINSHDEFNNLELTQVLDDDHPLLMSFLDDTQIVEDCDDEKLSCLIRSLEAEIDQRVIHDDQHSSSEDNNWTNNLCDDEYGDLDSQNIPRSYHNLDFNWMEMLPSSASDGMASWYMDPCGDDQMDGITEFASDDQNTYYFQHFNGVPMEEHECSTYATLWQESNSHIVH